MRRIVIMAVLATSAFFLKAQTPAEQEQILRMLGAMNLEEADGQDVETLMDLLRHPVKINYDDRRKLQSSGLFTEFQIASLEDYRSRHGYVLSLTELSSVDGFTKQLVQRLSPFISLEGSIRASDAGRRKLDGEINARAAVKISEDKQTAFTPALRARLEYGDALGLTVAKSSSTYSAGFAWAHRRGSILIGDFNARFAQGLCMWNTVTFNNLSTPSSFMRRPSGISQSYSFTGNYAMSGVAADLTAGKWKISCLVNLPNIKKIRSAPFVLAPGVNITRYFRFGHIGLTHLNSVSDPFSKDFRLPEMKTSADFSLCIKGVNLFGETMYDWVASTVDCIAGTETTLWEKFTVAWLVRRLSKKEHGVALSGEVKHGSHHLVFSSDFLYRPDKDKLPEGHPFQVKGQLKWRYDIVKNLYMEIRLAERYRTWGLPFRTDVRVDVHADIGSWAVSARFNALKCDGTGLLGYAEGSYSWNSRSKVYLRAGLFRIDDWDDRIYVYERDAPGSFNVPAYYGRGGWVAAYTTWRFAQWGSICFRGAYKKPGKAELKLQLTLHL